MALTHVLEAQITDRAMSGLRPKERFVEFRLHGNRMDGAHSVVGCPGLRLKGFKSVYPKRTTPNPHTPIPSPQNPNPKSESLHHKPQTLKPKP